MLRTVTFETQSVFICVFDISAGRKTGEREGFGGGGVHVVSVGCSYLHITNLPEEIRR